MLCTCATADEVPCDSCQEQHGRFLDAHSVVDQVRAIAKELGWGIGSHGTMVRDIDLIGVPWTAEAVPADTLVLIIMERLGMTRYGTQKGKRAHGRQTYLLLADHAEHQQ